MLNKLIILLFFSISFILNVQAKTPFDTVDRAIDYRQSSFQVLAGNFKDIMERVKGEKAWDADIVKVRAEHLNMMAKVTFTSFLKDSAFITQSDAKSDDDSNSLAIIWTEKDKFEVLFKDFQSSTEALLHAAEKEEKKEIAKALKEVGSFCKKCHQRYKKSDD